MTNRSKRRVLTLAWLLAALIGSAQAEVWKCRAPDGSTIFSDRPCPGSGSAIEERQLRGNAIDGPRLSPAAPAGAASLPAADSPSAAAPANDCPGDQELRHMETRASSTTLGDKERAFMQDEIRRVRQCRKGLGRYSAADWAISREAQAAQSNLKGAAEARRRAEDMHSAANPQEGERIERQRQAEAAAERQAQRQIYRPQPCPPRGSTGASVPGCR